MYEGSRVPECDRCGHGWAVHLLGELMIGCTEADCGCRRLPEDHPGTGCAACGAPVWRNPVGTADAVCREHRRAAQETMRRRFAERLANAANAQGRRRH